MSFIDWLLRRRRLEPGQAVRLDAWQALPESALDAPHAEQRFMVVDVESTGLDVLNDRLIAIGAVAVENSRIALDGGFYRVLRQDRPSAPENILVHGIGGTAQTAGDEPAAVLLDFLEYIGKSPLVGYHAQFDDIMIRKALRRYLGTGFRRTWLDLAYLAPAICPETSPQPRGLDDWLEAFGIVNYSRHDALADSLASAQLLLVLMSRAGRAGRMGTADLVEGAKSVEWLSRQRR